MGVDPVALDQGGEQTAVEAALGAIVDVLRHGVMAQPGMAQARAETPILAMDGFALKEQGQPVGMGKTGGLVARGQIVEGLGHALEAKAVQLVEGGMGQQGVCLLQW